MPARKIGCAACGWTSLGAAFFVFLYSRPAFQAHDELFIAQTAVVVTALVLFGFGGVLQYRRLWIGGKLLTMCALMATFSLAFVAAEAWSFARSGRLVAIDWGGVSVSGPMLFIGVALLQAVLGFVRAFCPSRGYCAVEMRSSW